MLSTKETVHRVLDHLPDDCTMDQVLERLRFVELVDSRVACLNQPDAETVTQDEIERTVAVWLSRSAG